MLMHHDHPDCEDFGYVNDTGSTCDTCKALWWRHFTRASDSASPGPVAPKIAPNQNRGV